jgi:hypothetical protein
VVAGGFVDRLPAGQPVGHDVVAGARSRWARLGPVALPELAELRAEAVGELVAGTGGQYRCLSKIDAIYRMGASDIFVSYAREDQARVASVVTALEARGWSVFWDRRIPAGQTWRSHIGGALEQARCVVVAWSEHAIQSEWVIEEAERGKQRHILVPVLLDPVGPPLGFGGIQAADLSGWSPERPSPVFDSFLADLGAVLEAPAPQGASTSNVAPMPAPTLAANEDAANQSSTAETPLPDCDRPAVDSNDNQKHAPGAAPAIASCKAALARRPSGLNGRRLVLGGLVAVALLGTGIFLARPNLWPFSIDDNAHSRASTNNPNTGQIDGLWINIIDVRQSHDENKTFIELQYSVTTGSNLSWNDPSHFVQLISGDVKLAPEWASVPARTLPPNSRQDILVKFPSPPNGSALVVFRFGDGHHLDLPVRMTD